MGCQGGRGSIACALCVLLLAALAWASPASANTIAVSSVRVAESGSADFTITRSAGWVSPSTTVNVRTVDGSARSPSDYTAMAAPLTFGSTVLPETQTQHVVVALNDDALDEIDESFSLEISGSEVPGAGSRATATIDDNDPRPSLSVADSPAVNEGTAAAKAVFVVRIAPTSGRRVSLAYKTVDDGAKGGQDYAPTAGTLDVPAGSGEARVEVPVLDDGIDEPAESFQLQFGAPDGADAGEDRVATATIVDDDEPPASPQAADPKPAPAATPGPPSPGAPGTPATGSTSGSSSGALPALGVSSPRLKRPSTVLVTVSCPQSAGRCTGRITLFSIPSKRSSVKALRKERRLGRVKFAVQGGRSQTFSLALGRTDLRLLKRTGRMRVRAYAITQDAAGRAGVRTVSGTLIARTAHSSPSRG